MKKKEKTIYGLIGSILLLILIVSTSYAYIKLNKEEKETNILGTDCIKLEMEEKSNAIELHHAYPVTDEVGKTSTPYIFTLTNECGVGVNYEIHLRKEDGNIAASNIATSVDGKDKVKLTNKVPTEEEKEEYKINNEELTLKPYETVEHNVRIWLDESAGNDTQNGTFKSKVVIEAVQNQVAIYKEEILHGADPVLYDISKETELLQTASVEETTDTLVPVKIDDEGKVTKADVTTEWYNYENKKWANAVILVDNEKAKELEAGDPIQEEEIESYFVWIPKYRYKIFDMGDYDKLEEQGTEYVEKSKPIEIEFGLEDTEDEQTTAYKQCKTPGTSGDSGQCHVGDWMTHPAFKAFPGSKGMWVGKFETGYKQTEDLSNTTNWTKEGAQQNEQAPTKVIIKPNVYSWRNITIGNAYKTSYDYQRELDSHMMKNTEWGEVAYLSHSKYGTCNENTCTEVRINNNSNYITGYAAIQIPSVGFTGKDNGYESILPGKNGSKTYNYKDKNSTIASTTGNYNGVYDMSGGAWEYVAGFVTGHFGSSELVEKDLINSKYYDAYKSNTSQNDYSKRILGDATGEMGPFSKIIYEQNERIINSWYKDESKSITDNYWYNRGEHWNSGLDAGIFTFSLNQGGTSNYNTFRIVLTPTNDAL